MGNLGRALVASVGLAGCSVSGPSSEQLAGSAAAAEPAPNARGGTAVVGIDLMPPCFNVYLLDCNLFIVSQIAQVALPGAFRIRPDFSYEPVLVDRVDVSAD